MRRDQAACTYQKRAIFTALQGQAPYSTSGDQLRISYDAGRQALTYRAAAT
ncbi:MAG: hypothetical protein HGA45_36120 [Chloroflexales bacterium]|nr:hypothetical protein [Chloroflexales bacterium]